MSHIRHLEKAAQMAMNVNNLLQEERADGERKARNKARKHANIGKDVILNVQEGRDRVQQLNEPVDEHLDLPPPVRRQRAPPRCSGCNIIGHDIRNGLIMNI